MIHTWYEGVPLSNFCSVNYPVRLRSMREMKRNAIEHEKEIGRGYSLLSSYARVVPHPWRGSRYVMESSSSRGTIEKLPDPFTDTAEGVRAMLQRGEAFEQFFSTQLPAPAVRRLFDSSGHTLSQLRLEDSDVDNIPCKDSLTVLSLVRCTLGEFSGGYPRLEVLTLAQTCLPPTTRLHVPKLEKLDLSFTDVSAETLNSISRSCIALQEVNLASCPNIGDDELFALARNNANLRGLNLMCNTQKSISDAGMARCCNVMYRLRSMLLNGSRQLGPLTVASLAKNALYLRWLAMNDLAITDEVFRKIFKMAHLEILEMRHCVEISAEVLVEFLKEKPLKRLDVSFIPSITDDALAQLRQAGPACEVVRTDRTFVDPNRIDTLRVMSKKPTKKPPEKKKKK
eukprot:GEMP01050639.1.p1 GENE.GEMP01050639.1~~GEMP01050639.1.p1  ORF type:complete len:449 (+),score=71.17 GEMP01050639.1:153-1349(+)